MEVFISINKKPTTCAIGFFSIVGGQPSINILRRNKDTTLK
jgi:hypothetical protein